MVLEEEIPKFTAWIGPALVSWLFVAGLVAVFAAALAEVDTPLTNNPIILFPVIVRTPSFANLAAPAIPAIIGDNA
jgi:hypothetical protein